MSPGNVSPSARKANFAVPLSSAVAIRTNEPETQPTSAAVPVQLATALRQIGGFAPLNLTSNGSVARPRDALSTNE